MEDIDKDSQKLGIKHWLFQTIPPLLMLSILFGTRHGSALVFLSGLFVLPVLISFISILAKIIKFKKRKYFLIRPLLTILVFILILSIANWTYKIALQDAEVAAKLIHDDCNKNHICPTNPDGWSTDGSLIRKNDLGGWLKYSAMYSYDENKLFIRVYQGPDIGDNISGGVNSPFLVEPYRE